MNMLYPKIRLAHLPSMLGYATLGAILAGIYGVVHDQLTYSISAEYFTRFKFVDFHYADFGLPRRVFVAEIGFLATWWVGFFSAWFIARVTVPAFSGRVAFRYSAGAFLIVLAGGLLGAAVGYVFGVLHGPDYSAWEAFTSACKLTDVPSFVRVAYIHNAGYSGGLVGLVAAIIYVVRLRAKTRAAQPPVSALATAG